MAVINQKMNICTKSIPCVKPNYSRFASQTLRSLYGIVWSTASILWY